ncbi:MAG: hypothetical protein DMG57_36910 [Acidobacteria bacterium]|nr:MAG: hypothetical protein DMG57_36910 [Acidobacteriota bacterium]
MSASTLLRRRKFTLSVQVADAASHSGTQTFSLTVTSGLAITTNSQLPSGSLTSTYSQSLTATGGQPPYSWVVINGLLPPGITLNAGSGTLSGTPNSIGKYSFTIQITDASAIRTQKDFTLQVASLQSQTLCSMVFRIMAHPRNRSPSTPTCRRRIPRHFLAKLPPPSNRMLLCQWMTRRSSSQMPGAARNSPSRQYYPRRIHHVADVAPDRHHRRRHHAGSHGEWIRSFLEQRCRANACYVDASHPHRAQRASDSIHRPGQDCFRISGADHRLLH